MGPGTDVGWAAGLQGTSGLVKAPTTSYVKNTSLMRGSQRPQKGALECFSQKASASVALRLGEVEFPIGAGGGMGVGLDSWPW